MIKVAIILSIIMGLYFLRPSASGDVKTKHLPPPMTLDQTHFGFNLVLSDLLWLDFIQRSFDCSRYEDPENCVDRWPYKVLNEASQLDPRFLFLYTHGAVQLSVINDDHKGAAEIFERGVSNIHDSWVLYYRAAYLNMIELDRKEKAAAYLIKAGDLGAPEWTKSLAAKLYTKMGQIELSYRTLRELYDQVEDGPWRDEIKERLNKLSLQIREPASR